MMMCNALPAWSLLAKLPARSPVGLLLKIATSQGSEQTERPSRNGRALYAAHTANGVLRCRSRAPSP